MKGEPSQLPNRGPDSESTHSYQRGDLISSSRRRRASSAFVASRSVFSEDRRSLCGCCTSPCMTCSFPRSPLEAFASGGTGIRPNTAELTRYLIAALLHGGLRNQVGCGRAAAARSSCVSGTGAPAGPRRSWCIESTGRGCHAGQNRQGNQSGYERLHGSISFVRMMRTTPCRPLTRTMPQATLCARDPSVSGARRPVVAAGRSDTAAEAYRRDQTRAPLARRRRDLTLKISLALPRLGCQIDRAAGAGYFPNLQPMGGLCNDGLGGAAYM